MNILREQSTVKTYNKFSKLPLGSVTAEGWLKDQLLRNKEGMGGHLDELEPDMIATPFLNYSAFKKHPILGEADPTFAAGWSGEISGTYWTGLVQLAFTLDDKELIEKATKWVEGVLKHQEADGYLGSYPVETDRKADYNAWSATWCYRALLAFYEATGRQDVLDAVYRGLLWFCDDWKEHKTDYVGSIIIEPMIILYAYTGDERLVQFCEDYLDWLEKNSKWQNKVSQYLSDYLPYVSMHAVAYGEDVKHPALVYCASGKEELLQASLNGTQKAVDRIVQPTGGPSSSSEFLAPKGATQETEYCNFATYNHTYSWMGLITGETCWADEMERCLFNGAQGARKKDERAIAYFTSPNQLCANRESVIYADGGEYGVYAPCYNVACCPTQSVRIIPEFIRSMVMTDEKQDTYLYCYGPAKVKAPHMEFTMETLYPFRDNIRLHIHRAEKANLYLRIPAWCKEPQVMVNGTKAELTTDDKGFGLLNVALNSEDEVEICFPMDITISKLDDSAAASKFPIVIERGPLVYALPVKEQWIEYPGRPITELPEGWCWYEAMPEKNGVDTHDFFYNATFSKAIDEHVKLEDIKVIEHDTEGYVWEEPPVTLEVPLYHARYAYMFLSPKMSEATEVPIRVEGDTTPCQMVPHGCTNLRITYLPRADV